MAAVSLLALRCSFSTTPQAPCLLPSSPSSSPPVGCAAALPSSSHIAITRRSEWIDDLLLAAPFPRRVSCHIIGRRGGCRCSSRRSAPSTGGNQAERTIATGCGLGDADMLGDVASETETGARCGAPPPLLLLHPLQALDAVLPCCSSFSSIAKRAAAFFCCSRTTGHLSCRLGRRDAHIGRQDLGGNGSPWPRQGINAGGPSSTPPESNWML